MEVAVFLVNLKDEWQGETETLAIGTRNTASLGEVGSRAGGEASIP